MTFGNGKPATRWSDRTAADARKVRCGDVRDGILRTYPTLANIADVLPADIKAALSAAEIGRVAGLFLMGVEAEIIANAMDTLLSVGGVPLPIHDGLIIAARFGEAARSAMYRAFAHRVGVEPTVR